MNSTNYEAPRHVTFSISP